MITLISVLLAAKRCLQLGHEQECLCLTRGHESVNEMISQSPCCAESYQSIRLDVWYVQHIQWQVNCGEVQESFVME